MPEGGLRWILREDRSRQAARTAHGGFGAEDQPGRGTPAHVALRNASNADLGLGGSLPRREGWERLQG